MFVGGAKGNHEERSIVEAATNAFAFLRYSSSDDPFRQCGRHLIFQAKKG